MVAVANLHGVKIARPRLRQEGGRGGGGASVCRERVVARPRILGLSRTYGRTFGAGGVVTSSCAAAPSEKGAFRPAEVE